MSSKKMGLFFQPSYWRAKPRIGKFLCVEQSYPSAAVHMVMLQQLCGAAGWDVPALFVPSDLSLASQNTSPAFEDQAFKTGI